MNTKLKQKINFRKAILVLLLIVAGVFVYRQKFNASAQSVDDLQSQKQAVQQKLDSINSQIQSYQSQISRVQKQANTLNNQIKLLNLEIQTTQASIAQTQAKIDAANLEIADVTAQIVQTESDISKQKDVLRDLIAQINDLDQRSPLEIALEDNNFTDFLNDLQYNTSIQERSQEVLNQIQKLQADLQDRQTQLKQQKDELDQLKQQEVDQNNNLNNQLAGKQQLLSQTKGKESTYQKLLAASKSAQDQLNDEINNLDDQIASKLGKNVLLTPHKGLLAWPMKGTITQGYGKTGFTALGYNFHNGLDIAAAPGTPIRAAGDGTVIGVGYAPPGGIDGAYGNWVAIKHDQGKFAAHPIITLYGHMSSFVVKKGQALSEGQLIGYEGNTGNTTRILYGPERGFHLHFTVFDAQGFTIVPGAYQKKFGAYQVPAGAPYNPNDFLD